ncbi:transcription regulator HTH, apses-type DNA-binding domain-containing protein, partial [Piptocephalis cylindrospora]
MTSPAPVDKTSLNPIYQATYSNIRVYETLCRGISVMRRCDDLYLNATQILKVAAFDKPQRTRILEREVQTGPHEKVQGGYGKYQGTWVSRDRAISLAIQYGVYDELLPLI